MANRLFKKTGVYFVGNFSSKVISAIIVPIYAVYVSSADLGEYDYLLTLTQIIAPVAYLAIWEAILKFCINGKAGDAERAIVTVLRFCVPLVLGTTAAVICASLALSYPPENALALGAMVAAYALARIWQYAARGLSRSKDYAWSGIISSFGFFAGVILLVCVAKTGFAGLSASYILGQLSIVVFLEFRCPLLPRALKGRTDRPLLKSMLRYSTPCVANLVALSLLVGFGRIVTVNYLGADANGQYAFAMKFATIVTSLGSIFSMAVIEEGIIRSGSVKLAEFYSTVSNSLLKILCAVISVLMPCVYLFYILIASTDYSAAAGLTAGVLLYAALTVMATQFGSVFMATNKTDSIATTTMFGLIVTAALTLGLIGSFGLDGVIFGLAGGTAAMTVSRWWLARKSLNFVLSVPWTAGLLAAYAAESIVCWLLYKWTNVLGLALAACVLAAAYVPIALKALSTMRRISD